MLENPIIKNQFKIFYSDLFKLCKLNIPELNSLTSYGNEYYKDTRFHEAFIYKDNIHKTLSIFTSLNVFQEHVLSPVYIDTANNTTNAICDELMISEYIVLINPVQKNNLHIQAKQYPIHTQDLYSIIYLNDYLTNNTDVSIILNLIKDNIDNFHTLNYTYTIPDKLLSSDKYTETGIRTIVTYFAENYTTINMG